jgi:uncharacterized membrane protein YraQ (UPF0718 family)/copper chaperone CopZ
MIEWLKLFFKTFWELSVDMAPYLLLGFLIAGLLNGVFSKEWMKRKMGKKGIGSAIKASLFGIPLPLCSCGVIPTGVSFHQQGASKGATTSFLISTPQTGVDSILVTYSLMGWAFAIVRPIIAFITGVLGGLWADSVKTEDYNSTIPNKIANDTDQSSIDAKKEHWFNRIFVYAFHTFLQDISRWLILGLGFATLITVLVPDSWFTEHLDTPWINMLIVLAASVPLYVCATASVPIAAALLLKGISPGAAIVFLMAGPATNVATFTVLWKTIGKKTTIIYLASIILGAMIFGIIIDYFLPSNILNYFIPQTTFSDPHAHHLLPHWLMIGSGIVMLYLIAQAEILKFIPKKHKLNMEKTNKNVYRIEGMTCNHCVANVDKNIKAIDGVSDALVDLQSGKVEIIGNVSAQKIASVIESLGYTFKGKIE